jgi:PIN domain nuclease of toxin-antitoxin system
VRAVVLGREGFHNDPADGFIVAAALVGGHTLLTADRRILGRPGELPRIDVRTGSAGGFPID